MKKAITILSALSVALIIWVAASTIEVAAKNLDAGATYSAINFYSVWL